MKLSSQTSFAVNPKPPFHFDATFHKPSHFPNNLKLNHWQPGHYWQSLRFGKHLYGLKIENVGTTDDPSLRVSLYSTRKLTETDVNDLKAEITWRFELNTDLTEFNRLVEQDERFAPIFKKWIGMRAASHNTLYELLIIAITLQNATVRRSQQMLNTLLNRFGTQLAFDDTEVWAIWLPEELHVGHVQVQWPQPRRSRESWGQLDRVRPDAQRSRRA
jgi:3-methyladenine DNA glycosylase/8-oxoguanine DNA glycosylase